MLSLEKNRIILFPFFMGLVLLFISWYLSYPLSVDSVDDFVFNHVSILYWVSLSLILPSSYLIAVTSKKNSLRLIIVIGIVFTIYSLSYFYSMLPGSDQHFYRGLTEYFIETKNLDPLQPNHSYYQWPLFFILSYVMSAICGLSIRYIEFILYTVIGFLMVVSLYFYASRRFKKGGFLAVPVFFVSMFLFLNYQCGPFALALSLILLLFMLETHRESIGSIITIIILFTSTVVTHLFVPLFFVVYLMMRTILDKNKHYTNLLLFALTLFFIYQFTLAQYSFATYLRYFLTASSEYTEVFQATITTTSIPIDILAQQLSRLVTISFAAICGVGFLFLLLKRKLRTLDKAILLTGILYSGVGFFLAALGSRAIALAFIPVSLGTSWLFERVKKSKNYLKNAFSVLLVVLLILFSFVPIHQSFNPIILFHTQETYDVENFLVENTNWEKTVHVLAYASVIPYIETKLDSFEYFTYYLQEGREPDIILYTSGLGKYLLSQNYTMEEIFSSERLNVLYDNGFSYIATRS